jgi:hypothetical protein
MEQTRKLKGSGGAMSDGLFGRGDPRAGIPTLMGSGTDYHQLLILGNGFDLECGLPTRFCHFFEPRLEALNSQDWQNTDRLEGLGYEATPTIWDFLLRSNMYAPWYSVEDAVRDLVMSAGGANGEGGASGLGAKMIKRLNGLAATNDEESGLPAADDVELSDE